MSLPRVLACALIVSAGPTLLAGNAAPEIWGRTILKQPFDKEPFREVNIPAWVEDTVGVGYTLSGMNFEQRKRAAEAGITISEIGFVDPFYVYYDSKLLHKRSPHVPPERLEKDIAEYRKLGVRLLAVYPPCLQGEVYENHPEWRRISENTTKIPQIDMVKYPHGGMLCLLGPYSDFFIDVLAEIVSKFQVDAFSFDGLHYGGVCYCQYCRGDYRAETGEEIPAVNLEEPAFRRYQHWADRRMERTIQKMQTRLKGIKPDFALVTWTTNAGRFGHFRDIPRNMPARMNLLLDAPDQEFWLDETNRGATVVPALANAYIWAVTNHRVAFSEPYLMSHGNPYGKDSFPGHEVLRRMMLSIAWGVSPSIAVGQPEYLQAAIFDALAEVKRRKPWITHKSPEPWAAIVLSDNSRVFYGRSSGQVEDRYLSNVLGFFRASIEEHLPFAIINDWNLNPVDLAPYQVVVLPNTACLNTEQLTALRDYVAGGGGLVATLDTSLYDDLGNPRSDFGLSDVFGVSYKGITQAGGSDKDEIDVNFAKGVDASYWQKRKNIFNLRVAAGDVLDVPAMRSLIGKEPVTFKGSALAVEAREDGPKAAATLEAPGVSGAKLRPALLTRAYGKGKVAYFPTGIDAAYYLYPYPYQRVVLTQAMRWASSGPPPVEVKAPMCVHANVFRQKKDGERLVIHLYNDVNTTAFHALPNEDVPLREETIPIHGIRVRIRGADRISRIHWEPDGQTLAPKEDGGVLEVEVPRLEVHGMVVCELKP